jgi:hypothetical protein
VSENFTVEGVIKREEWEGSYGAMVTYRLRVNGEEVDLNQKPETPAPTEGQQIYGHLEPGKFRQRLKKDKRPDGSTSTSGSSDYSKRSRSNGKSADQTASIHRQVALKILAPLVIKEGLTDQVRSKVAQIEEFIGEAGHKQDVQAAIKEAFPNAQPVAEGAGGQDDDIPF